MSPSHVRLRDITDAPHCYITSASVSCTMVQRSKHVKPRLAPGNMPSGASLAVAATSIWDVPNDLCNNHTVLH